MAKVINRNFCSFYANLKRQNIFLHSCIFKATKLTKRILSYKKDLNILIGSRYSKESKICTQNEFVNLLTSECTTVLVLTLWARAIVFLSFLIALLKITPKNRILHWAHNKMEKVLKYIHVRVYVPTIWIFCIVVHF